MSSNIPVSPIVTVAAPGSFTYPANRLGWLHKFCNLLDRAEVAREIGRDGMLLILAIAVQEDALRYASAPILFDSELQRLTGIRSRQHLDRIRQRAIDAGWLVVVRSPDGDQMVARYWTLIPKRLNVFHDPTPIGVVSDSADGESRPKSGGKELNSEQAVTTAARAVGVCESPSLVPFEPGPSVIRSPTEVLGLPVGPPAVAELTARIGSAGASPSLVPAVAELAAGPGSAGASPSTVQMVAELASCATSTGASPSLTQPSAVETNQSLTSREIAHVPSPEVLGTTPNTPLAAVTVQVATGIGPANAPSVAAQVAKAVQIPRQPIAMPVVLKKLSDYPPILRAQAEELLSNYPNRLDTENGLLAVCRALGKITYHDLRPLVMRYSVARNRPGQDLRLTPCAAKWFDEERWTEGPCIWEIRDKDRLKKST